MKHLKLKSFFLALLLTCGVGQMWATARTFKSGEKIYFKDTWKANGNGSTWKVDESGAGTLCAYFYGDGDGWYKCYGSDNVYGNWNAENTIYEITVPGTGKNFTHVVFTRGKNDPYAYDKWANCWNKTMPQAPDEGNNIFYVNNSYTWNENENKYNGSWGKYAHNGALIGDFNDWNPDTYPLSNSGVKGVLVPLEASTTYNFKILLGETYYGINSASTITGTLTTWWTFFSGQGNVPIQTDVAGDYGFAWNGSTKNVTVYYPDALYPKSKYLYFDVRNETYWNANPFTARFYLKYFDSGTDLAGMPLECSSPVEGNVYYVQVPDNGYIGHVQMNRWYNNALDGTAEPAHVYDHSAVGDNCLKEQSGKTNYKDSWTPQWTTYCPPMSSATLSDNSTTKISWQTGNGTSGNPYLVPRTGTIKVSASATKAVPDDNMTMNYDFKVNTGSGASSEQNGTTATYDKSSLINNTTYEMSLDAYNTYNGATGTKNTSATHIWYKALDVYSVTNTLTNISSNGRSGNEAAAYGIAYTATLSVGTGYNLPTSITVKRGETTLTPGTHYSYNSSTGALTVNAAQVSGNLTIIASGVAQEYSITYKDKDNAVFTGAQDGAPTTHTYGTATNLMMPTRDHYTFAGWFTASNCESGQIGNTTAAQLGATAFTANITLYAKWTEITHTVSFANDGHGSTTPNTNQTVGEVTGVSISATPSKGYTFNTWTITSGSGTFTSSASTASNTFKPSADATLTASFNAETYDGDIEGVDGTDGAYTVTFDNTSIVINTTPVRAGYHIERYYLTYSAPDYSNPIAEPNGELVKSAVYGLNTYTDSDGKWQYEGAPTLYAKWAVDTYTLTLHENIPSGTTGIAGTGSVEVTYDDVDYTPGKLTLPRAEGYTFAGYYTAAVGGAQIYTNDGSIHTSATDGVTNYTSNVAKWIYAGDVDLYAHWTVTSTYVFKGGKSGSETDWDEDDNWTKGVAPSANNGSEDIIILAPVEIPASATTNVNSVRIGTVGSYTPVGGSAITADGSLTIPATAMLIVEEDVKNYDFDEEKDVNTTTSTLHIKSASSGNGALVWGTSGTPGRAQVDFYTLSGGSVNSTASINQYIGTPFSDAIVVYNYYDSWTFKINAAGTAWERLEGNGTMYPFVGYDVIYNGDPGHIYQMDGTLVTNADRNCSLTFTTDGAENLLANSWTAPMWIKGFANDDFTNADASIYIFNSTSEDDSKEDVSVGGGNYDAYTPGTSDAYIPSMQSFSVLSTGGTGSVKLNYTNLVKTPASHTHIGAMHAPSRFADGETEPEEDLEPKMDFLRLRVADTNGWADELKIYIREDFVEEFENGFDARKMYGDPAAPTLYGISPDGRMAINCIPTADNHVVGFHGGSASNEYTFRFAYDGEEELYLLDNKTGAETLISAEDTYSFTTEAGDNDLRFSIIRKTPAVPTDIETVTGEGLQTTGVQKIMYNGMLYILRSGRIYDATGALVK